MGFYVKYSDVFEIRLEDLIYLTILAGIMVMFNIIVPDWGNTLFKGYRIFCIILFLASMVCLMIKPGIKYLVLLIFCVLIPLAMKGVYSKVVLELFDSGSAWTRQRRWIIILFWGTCR